MKTLIKIIFNIEREEIAEGGLKATCIYLALQDCLQDSILMHEQSHCRCETESLPRPHSLSLAVLMLMSCGESRAVVFSKDLINA